MTVVTSTAQDIIDRAPLGAIIRFSDGTPQPPARFTRKRSAWETRNGTGRLTEKRGSRDGRPGDFTLHLGNCGTKDVVVLSMNRLYAADSRGTFTIERVPQPGEALVLTDFMGRTKLRHVAANEAAARSCEHRGRGMKQVRFTLSGTCLVPEGTTKVDGIANHVRLPGGHIVSIQPVIEMASSADADDHRDLTYDEAVALDLYLECEKRTIELDDETG